MLGIRRERVIRVHTIMDKSIIRSYNSNSNNSSSSNSSSSSRLRVRDIRGGVSSMAHEM